MAEGPHFAARLVLGAVLVLLMPSRVLAFQDLKLEDLIDEAMRGNPRIQATAAQAAAMEQRISQEASLMDPMVSLGYQNDGLDGYTYGDMPDSQWMVSLSQTFPFPGKRTLMRQAAALEADAEKAMAEAVRREVIAEVSMAYHELLLATKEIDILTSLKGLTEQVENIALSLYATAMMTQEEAIMAQAEKYMVMERLAMAEGKRDAAEAMLKKQIGRFDADPLGRPEERKPTPFPYTHAELAQKALDQAPELKAGRSLMLASQKKLARSRQEAWPDVTVMASYAKKGSAFDDMWGLTVSVPLPIFFSKKQGPAITEASWGFERAIKDLEARRLEIISEVRDNLAMIRAADKVIDLYQGALAPKARQQIDAALALLASGKMDATQALIKLKTPFDYELSAWRQQVLREKAIARIMALTGDLEERR